ncbi:MAG: aldolase catalytic domain-containing protein [Acutalibacteraceae bacterium]
MGKKGEILTFRPDIRVLDATIRDGGLVNKFYFTDEFVRDLYLTNVKSGVDYMEFGYKADKDIFSVDEFGKWKFCNEDDIISIVGDNQTDMKIAAMADVGRTNYKKDIGEKANSPVDLYRIATYIHQIPAAIEMIEHCHKMGYETTVNIMAISSAKEKDIDLALELLSKTPVDGIYIVDSYGSIFPEEMQSIADRYIEVAEKSGKFVGIHAHNNQQLAFANTIEAISRGASFADATVSSLGRGAGNCPLELLLGFLKNPKYNITSVLKFIEKHILPLKASGVKWGYDIQYMLTGQLSQHPRDAISFTEDNRTDYLNFYLHLLDRE